MLSSPQGQQLSLQVPATVPHNFTPSNMSLFHACYTSNSSHCHSVCRRMKSCVSWWQSMGLQTGQSLPRPSPAATASPAGALCWQAHASRAHALDCVVCISSGAHPVTTAGGWCLGSVSSRQPSFQDTPSWQTWPDAAELFLHGRLTHSYHQYQLHALHVGYLTHGFLKMTTIQLMSTP
jgi:hypothetical protein